MSGILFENDTDWWTRNWIFRRFMTRIINQCQPGDEIVFFLMRGVDYTLLNLPLLRTNKGDIVDRVVAIVEAAARRDAIGKGSDLGDLEAQGQQMYLQSMSRLVATIEEYKKWNGS